MLKGAMDSVKSVKLRGAATHLIRLGSLLSMTLILWKLLVLVSGSETPVVIVLTGSMEPGFRRGDALFLNMKESPIQSGEIVVFKIEGKDIPIVHRVIKVHRNRSTNAVQMVTKGDNNLEMTGTGYIQMAKNGLSKITLLAEWWGKYLPYVGYATIIMTEKPWVKLLLAGMSLLVFTW